jgi:hypothetical protein
MTAKRGCVGRTERGQKSKALGQAPGFREKTTVHNRSGCGGGSVLKVATGSRLCEGRQYAGTKLSEQH